MSSGLKTKLDLSPGRLALVDAALGLEESTSNPVFGRIPRNDVTLAPLSFAQQRLWFLDQFEPNSPAYNILNAIRLRGELDVSALEQSINEVVRRHEALRTTFPAFDGEAVQKIAQELKISLRVELVEGRSESEREAEALRMATEESRRAFDLARGPLIRARLLRLSEEDHILLLSLHHIVADGWSMAVLFRELRELYKAFREARPSPLPGLLIQYKDYAVWQHNWLKGEVLQQQMAYWRRQLAGELPVLQLPTDRQRSLAQSFCGARHKFTLPRVLSERLRALSRQEGVTLFVTLLAAFKVLLNRYTGEEDICVGAPVANRNRSEIEPLVGLFANTLALRTDLSGDPSFLELLRRVRDVTWGAYDYQELPFEKLVEELHPERDLSRTLLFQVMFVMHDQSMLGVGLPGTTDEFLDIDNGTSKYELTLFISDQEHTLSGWFEYNTDLFDRTTVDRLGEHFRALLGGIVADPSRRISRIPLLTDAERHQLLVGWNQTGLEYPVDSCLHELFEQQVQRSADAVAVVSGDDSITYEELNRRANEVAAHLRAVGAGPEIRVAVFLRRSIDLVVGILGILKAGAAYVPLDPTYPSARVAYILADSEARIVLTQRALEKSIPPCNASIVSIDGDWLNGFEEKDPIHLLHPRPHNLSYLIYTSGSTGQPKGVAIEHRNAVAFIQWAKSVFSPEDIRRVLASTSICFDLSVFEIFLPLSSGGTVVVAQTILDLHGRSPEQVTLVNTVPSAISALLEGSGLPGSVRTVALAGELLSQDLVERIYEQTNVKQVLDLYGPTEATTYSTMALREECGVATIGRPISNTRVYILDREFQPVPIGVAGELYIGGEGVARGYLNRPDLTAQKFVPNPFADAPGARLFRTGDRARYLPSGQIQFLGRLDAQVKLRGYRIELGEIEAALLRYPGVREAAVCARDNQGLVAYVAGCTEATQPDRELKAYLAQQLPAYMLPSEIVRLEKLPTTPNGKIDRRLLARPGAVVERSGRARPPRDAFERKLAELWESLLGVTNPDISEDFFDLGGHSLLAAKLFAALERTYGKRLPLATLFRAPTIEKLAGVLRDEGCAPANWRSLVPIKTGGSLPPLFCVHGLGGNILGYRQLASYLDPELPVYGLQARGLNGKESPMRSVRQMATHYIREISELQPEGPYLLAGHSLGGLIAFEMAVQLTEAGQEVALLALFDTYRSCSAPPSLLSRLRRSVPRIFTREGLSRFSKKARLMAERRMRRFRAAIHRVDMDNLEPAGLDRLRAANREAFRTYEPRPFSGRVTLFRAADDVAWKQGPTPSGWESLAALGVDSRMVRGNHVSMMEEPHVETLARQLMTCIERAQQAGRAG